MNNYSISKGNMDIRAEARMLLTGNWGRAVIVILIYSLIAGVTGSLRGMTSGNDSELTFGLLAVATILVIAYSILVSNIVEYGVTITFLNFTRSKSVVFGHIFSGFKDYTRVAFAMFLRNMLVMLWGLLLIVPGIIKSYAYAMTEYLIADNPNIDGLTAITKSKEMMQGWKGKLFLLDLSLIGWWLLCFFTCGLGYLWLGTYQKTNRAIFYQELVGGPIEVIKTTSPDDLVLEAAQKEIERLNKEDSDFR